MMRAKWVIVILAVCAVCVTVTVGLMVHEARADAIGGPTAAVMGDTWSVIAGPISKGGDVVGYNIYVFQEKTGMLWAWEHDAERQLLRVPTRDQYEREGELSGASRPRGETR